MSAVNFVDRMLAETKYNSRITAINEQNLLFHDCVYDVFHFKCLRNRFCSISINVPSDYIGFYHKIHL